MMINRRSGGNKCYAMARYSQIWVGAVTETWRETNFNIP